MKSTVSDHPAKPDLNSKEGDSRERLIASTRELLWSRGYIGTSPSAIQERSGVGQGSMYHHFKGKPELALAAIERNVEELMHVAESRFASQGTAIERISAYLHAPRDAMRGCQAGRLVQDPDVIASPELRKPLTDLFEFVRVQLAKILSTGIEGGEFDPGLDPIATADMIAAVIQGGYVLARVSGDAAPFNRAIAAAIDMLKNRAELAQLQRAATI
ncbi:TetR/AcrR family transcriptional regulator [Aquirhabdus sp.]|uniref:TetR/AcrR family transcriptional regulator n=1 Tax=Aquirhabdus sp. TaxID=2824160 RepID=UPI00396CF85D